MSHLATLLNGYASVRDHNHSNNQGSYGGHVEVDETAKEEKKNMEKLSLKDSLT